jgi:DnaJ-class molecular chaperone
VARDASQQDIQNAYRRHAKMLHPDLNPGDKEAQRKFQDLSATNDILGDEKKRARFDRGEIDASGAERPQRQYYCDFAQEGTGSQRYANSSGFADFGNADDILSSFFSRGGRRGFRMRGDDRHYRLEVDFPDPYRADCDRRRRAFWNLTLKILLGLVFSSSVDPSD